MAQPNVEDVLDRHLRPGTSSTGEWLRCTGELLARDEEMRRQAPGRRPPGSGDLPAAAGGAGHASVRCSTRPSPDPCGSSSGGPPGRSATRATPRWCTCGSASLLDDPDVERRRPGTAPDGETVSGPDRVRGRGRRARPSRSRATPTSWPGSDVWWTTRRGPRLPASRSATPSRPWCDVTTRAWNDESPGSARPRPVWSTTSRCTRCARRPSGCATPARRVEPVYDEAATRGAGGDDRAITKALGERQDTVISRRVVRGLARLGRGRRGEHRHLRPARGPGGAARPRVRSSLRPGLAGAPRDRSCGPGWP